jgi:hypothetical protein
MRQCPREQLLMQADAMHQSYAQGQILVPLNGQLTTGKGKESRAINS